MATKYINKLTDDELKDLFFKLVQSYYGPVNIHDYSCSPNMTDSVWIKGMCASQYNTFLNQEFRVEIVFDDYVVYGLHNSIPEDNNKEVVHHFEKVYRKYMRSKFGEPYIHDCPLNDCSVKSKVANTDSNIDTINKWRQVINEMQEGWVWH